MLAPEAHRAIRIETREDGVVLPRLKRPEKRNAADHTMHGELAQLPRHAGSLDSRCAPLSVLLRLSLHGEHGHKTR